MKKPLPQKQKIIWPDNAFFFLTTSTCLHYPYFQEPEQKQIILDKLRYIKKVHKIPFQAYSIAINHFHIMFYLRSGKTMTQLKNTLHSKISREYKEIYQVKYKNFWQTTKTYFIKDEKMYWNVIGYIIGNLLKHQEVGTFQELKENPFSSYRYYTQKYGDETVQELVREIIDINETAENIVNFKQLKSIKTKFSAK